MEVKPLNPYTHQLLQTTLCSWEQQVSYILSSPRQSERAQLTPSRGGDPAQGVLLLGVGQGKHSTSQAKNKENFQTA